MGWKDPAWIIAKLRKQKQAKIKLEEGHFPEKVFRYNDPLLKYPLLTIVKKELTGLY